jgi:glycosyltransferase involved in cell wall biosynthesis
MTGKHVFFDTTILHYGGDLRGIPQVVLQLVRMFVSVPEFRNVRFIATKKVCSEHLFPLDIEPDRIAIVAGFPFFQKNILFHGLFCSFRYRKIISSASMIIHGEFRTVIKTDVPQAVIYYDLFLVNHFRESLQKTRSLAKRFFKRLVYEYLRHKLVLSLSAEFKITISDFTRRELLAGFPDLDPGSIVALPIGIRKNLSSTSLVAKQCSPDTISFLYVGGILDPRKNVFAMIENLPVIAGNHSFRLHLVGKISPESARSQLAARLQELKLSDMVTIHGLLQDPALEELYARSDFFLFPSLKEGFGLPVVEAMAHGMVVCAFNNTSIPEIGGDALILSENNDFESWGKAIGQLINDTEQYRLLSEKALHQAEKYSEENMFERYQNYFTTLYFLDSAIGKDTAAC